MSHRTISVTWDYVPTAHGHYDLWEPPGLPRATFSLAGKENGKDPCTVSVKRFHIFDPVDEEHKGQVGEHDEHSLEAEKDGSRLLLAEPCSHRFDLSRLSLYLADGLAASGVAWASSGKQSVECEAIGYPGSAGAAGEVHTGVGQLSLHSKHINATLQGAGRKAHGVSDAATSGKLYICGPCQEAVGLMKSSDIDQDLFTDSYCKVCSAQLISESQRVAHYESENHLLEQKHPVLIELQVQYGDGQTPWFSR
ncbi:Zinc finger matrin-type protein 4 [Galemys pyrenaicus]|uniref:Zinc finger matrin-type protein 4 n=1 Tax=Galemys pyrenaicus TaxID=202257 RepID=A0A8J6A263_GALPY|nr:Zinc finger matrin-type protein 4 [Galemys pyrenaicus]